MANEDARKSLESEILQEGRKKADALLTAAKAEAEKLLSEARATAQTVKDKALQEARHRADKRAEMILRTVEQEVARRKLRAREEIVQTAMDQAAGLVQNVSGADYRRAVVRMALEAVRWMCASDFVVTVTPVPGETLDVDALAAEIVGECRKHNRSITLKIQTSPSPLRGVIVDSTDGRMRWDNRFDTRLRRLRGDLRRRIVPVLFEEG